MSGCSWAAAAARLSTRCMRKAPDFSGSAVLITSRGPDVNAGVSGYLLASLYDGGVLRGAGGQAPVALGDALHVAAAFEGHALVDLQGRRGDVAPHPPRRVDLDGALGADVPDDEALDDDVADIDLGVQLGALADDEDVVGEDLTGELAVDADRALEGELALEGAAPAQEGVDLTDSVGADVG